MVGIILGMPGPWADNNYEHADHYSTKIGGFPDWPFPPDSIDHDLLDCNACGRNLCLIAQVYAPVSCRDMSIEERVIYILGCVIPHCESLSWRALRIQKISTTEEIIPSCNDVAAASLSASKNIFQNDLWSIDLRDEHDSDNDNDNDNDDIDLEELGRAFSEAANIAFSSKMKSNDAEFTRKPMTMTQQSNKDKTLVMPCFYIYAQEEKLFRKVTAESSKHTLPSVHEYGNDAETHSNDESYDEENYEYDRALNADRIYLKFKKRMDEYPEQCFRYSYGGEPLVYSGEVGEPGLCKHCGEPRHYEMQLMPPLIYFLQEAANDQHMALVEKFNWMTLIVYTCSMSCSPPPNNENSSGNEDWAIAEEEVFVQYE